MRKLVLGAILLVALALVVSLFLRGRQGGRQVQTSVSEADTKTVIIPVEGMVCASCTASVKRALESIAGVTEVEVSLERRETRVRYREGKTSPERLAAAINDLGYKAGTPAEQR